MRHKGWSGFWPSGDRLRVHLFALTGGGDDQGTPNRHVARMNETGNQEGGVANATRSAFSSAIRLSAPTPEHAIRCPACNTELARLVEGEMTFLQEGYYLDDGDAVDAAETTGPDDDCCLSSSLMVGRCKACNGHYYVIETYVMQGHKDVNFEYYTGERDLGTPSFAVASNDVVEDAPGSWLIRLYKTQDGPLQVHEMGPFKVEQLDDVRGEHGVSACQGRGRAEPWTRAAQAVRNLRPSLYEIARRNADLAAEVKTP